MQNDIISYTQHAGEVVARGAGAGVGPAGTREGARGSVSEGVQKVVRARESRHASAQSSGRSMIEMLGVLAIIGVLSVGALSGYRMAMTKYRANEVIDYAMRVGEGAVHHGYTQKTGSIPYAGNDLCKEYVNGEAAPFGVTCWPWDYVSGNVPVVALTFRNLPSPAVANAVCSRLSTDVSKSVSRDAICSTAGCPSTTQGQCDVVFFFKK